jgi:hypothetical protein
MRELRDPGESGRAALLDTTANRDDDGDSELSGRSLYGRRSCAQRSGGRRTSARPFVYELTGATRASWRSSSLATLSRQWAAIDAEAGSGKISSSPLSTASKLASATDSGDAFGYVGSRVISVRSRPKVRGRWPHPGGRSPRPLRSVSATSRRELSQVFLPARPEDCFEVLSLFGAQ